MSLEPGQRVRAKTPASIGLVSPENPYKFADPILTGGEEGAVSDDGPLPDGWIAVRFDAHPELYAPVHPSMIEPLS